MSTGRNTASQPTPAFASRRATYMWRPRKQAAADMKRWFGERASTTTQTDPWLREYVPTADAVDIFYCFRLLLGRSPHAEEWRGHSARAGEPLGDVVASYVASLEFSRRGMLARDHMDRVSLAELPGFRIYAAEDDSAVGRHVRHNVYEPDVTAVFRRLLAPGMGIIDIGANIGYFSMLSASIVGDSGYVLAIEPNARNARMLEASRRANGFGHVTVLQAAAGPRTGLLALHRSYSNGTTSALPEGAAWLEEAETVACVRPDTLVEPGRRIDLIKVDVEGAEYLALSGCTSVIERDRPVIVSEFSPDHMPGFSGIDGPGYLRWLVGLGYNLAVVEPDGSACEAAGIERVMTAYRERGVDHIDILATPVRR